MCNIAGFIGTTRAAPVLIEMIRRQEGLDAGYYTGIVTMTDDGTLHYEKVVGDLSTLLETTRAADLPGNVGIIHSRTKSGGGRSWAHPFVGPDDDIAYIANGSVGKYRASSVRDQVTRQLVEAGYTFSAISDREIGTYPRLPGGGSVHMSDLMCQLIDYKIKQGLDPVTAMAEAYKAAPSEIIGLMVHSSMPGRIIASRINQPLMIGRHRDGWVLASTALAFETESTVGGDVVNKTPLGSADLPGKGDGLSGIHVEWTVPMAPCSTAIFSPERFEMHPFAFESLVDYPVPLEKVRRTVLDYLSDGQSRRFADIVKPVKALWPEGVLAPVNMTVYETIRALMYDGLIRFDTVRVPGAKAQLSAPQTRIVLQTATDSK